MEDDGRHNWERMVSRLWELQTGNKKRPTENYEEKLPQLEPRKTTSLIIGKVILKSQRNTSANTRQANASICDSSKPQRSFSALGIHNETSRRNEWVKVPDGQAGRPVLEPQSQHKGGRGGMTPRARHVPHSDVHMYVLVYTSSTHTHTHTHRWW